MASVMDEQTQGGWLDRLGEQFAALASVLPPMGNPMLRPKPADFGRAVGPAAELWSGPKGASEKVLRSGAAIADLLAGPGTLAATYAPEAQAAIRRGGMPDLTGIHQIPLRRLLPWLDNDKLPREVYSPSVALNRGGIPQHFGEFSLIMRPDALDPVRVPGKIFNRDAYTPRTHMFAGTLSDNIADELREYATRDATLKAAGIASDMRGQFLSNAANRRLRDRFALSSGYIPEDTRLLEGVEPGYGQTIAIKASPAMRSFKEYEANPRGAAILSTTHDPAQVAGEVEGNFLVQMDKLGKQGNRMAAIMADEFASPGQVEREFNRYAKLADILEPGSAGAFQQKDIRDALRQASRAFAHLPSQYGELKVRGPVRLDASNWVAAAVDENNASGETIAKLLKQLQPRDIPLYMVGGNDELYDLAQRATNSSPSWIPRR